MEENNKVAVVACSGSSNTGQTTNEVAKKLSLESEDYSMVCLAALTLGHKSSLDKIENASRIVVVDGCPVKCASNILEEYTDKKADLDIQVMEDYSIKKEPRPVFEASDIEKITRDIKKKMRKGK
ncbi:MAG: putative zinc-binding protein [Actinomycetota bacterium]|nr:putative zinc-binding protein [Actinomycetota bacterium]